MDADIKANCVTCITIAEWFTVMYCRYGKPNRNRVCVLLPQSIIVTSMF